MRLSMMLRLLLSWNATEAEECVGTEFKSCGGEGSGDVTEDFEALQAELNVADPAHIT